MNPDAELNISQYRRAQQVPAETLYQAGWSENRHRVYQHYSDERTLVTDGQQVELPFISEESFNRLLQEGLQHLHIGLIMVRLYTLHRRSAGVNALVLIRDTRWRDDRAVISSMEMDLTSGTQLAYTAPDMTLSIRDFRDHIQLVIQTHGYEGWQGGESNILLSRSLIRRLSNTSHTNFRYNVQNVADHLASRGVRAIPGSQRTTTELHGRQWLVRPAVISQVQNPQVARIRARTDGSLSVRFSGYATTTSEQEAIHGENDEEELEQEFINLLTINDDWPYEDDPEFPEIYSDPEEFGEDDGTEQDDGSLLGKWFLAILKAEQTEPTVEMLEPINLYQWFAVEQLDSEDELVQMTFTEFNWLETIDAESEWFEEQALMMTCQWDESDEDETLSTVQFLSQLDAPANRGEDLLSLLAKGGGEDASSPNSKTKWDEDLFETVYIVEEMEYPQFNNLKKKVETVLSTAESSLTRIPPEPIMGPAMYPPGSRQPQNPQIPEIKARLGNIRGGYARQMNERFNLPTAQASQGAILVLPEDIRLYSKVISRWESITLNLINEKNWADNKSKVNYIENLLGETEKKTWIQWRMTFPTEYEELVNIADDPQNVISQIRRMFLLEDPTTGSTEEQDRAYNDLERLSCHNVKDLFDYINDYKILAAKSGRMYISPELSTKFFSKMPPIIGGEIEKAFTEKYPGNTVGVIPRIHFTYQYLAEQCKRVALQRSLKDLFDYINDYKILAAKSGRMYISPELSTKFFSKMPPIIGGEIEKAFTEKYPGNTVGVIPRIHFTYQYLAEQCKRVALQRSLKDLSFCSRIPVPGYYQKNKKYGLRKAKTYRGKPHDTHIRVFKRKHADKVRKCKCFICGEEGHFARNCTRQKGNIARSAIVENLDLDDDWDVISVDQNEPDSDAICSFSEGEGSTGHSLMAGINEVPYEIAMMITNEEISWRVVISVPQEIQNCAH
ncbi:polyprotein [Rhynchospora pubera]|uniref:Polyprotein n=1 Tax=Rhynchospora pubera TaxID=906938 RepID=A0AAV8DKM9_9POAL|nr:polyprotein [Rhynchospora pubera]